MPDYKNKVTLKILNQKYYRQIPKVGTSFKNID